MGCFHQLIFEEQSEERQHSGGVIACDFGEVSDVVDAEDKFLFRVLHELCYS